MIYLVKNYQPHRRGNRRGELVVPGLIVVIEFDESKWGEWARFTICNNMFTFISTDADEVCAWIDDYLCDEEAYNPTQWGAFPDAVFDMPVVNKQAIGVAASSAPDEKKDTAARLMVGINGEKLISMGFGVDVFEWINDRGFRRSGATRTVYEMLLRKAEGKDEFQAWLDRGEEVDALCTRLIDDVDKVWAANNFRGARDNRGVLVKNLDLLLAQTPQVIEFLHFALCEFIPLQKLIEEEDWWDVAMDSLDSGVSIHDIYA